MRRRSARRPPPRITEVRPPEGTHRDLETFFKMLPICDLGLMFVIVEVYTPRLLPVIVAAPGPDSPAANVGAEVVPGPSDKGLLTS